MTVRTESVTFVSLPVQQWQADAAGTEQQPAQEGVATPEVEMSMDDIFNKTFQELSSEGPVVEEAPAPVEADPDVVETPDVEGGLPDPATVAKGAAAPPAPTPTPDPATSQPAPKPATAEADKPIEQVLRELLGERQKAPVVEAKPEPPKYTVPDYTPEQKAIVDAYEAEFPEMARAEQIIRAREYHALTGFVYSQIDPVIRGQAEKIAQLESVIGTMVGQQQVQSIQSTVGADLNDIRPKIEAWVETQPEFIRPAYKAIVEKGNQQEVVGLIKEWQKATNAPVAKAPTIGRQPVAPVTAAPPKKVPAGLRPVPGMRSTPTETGIARDDYEGAFAAFSHAGTG